jgi:hypothetical protein
MRAKSLVNRRMGKGGPRHPLTYRDTFHHANAVGTLRADRVGKGARVSPLKFETWQAPLPHPTAFAHPTPLLNDGEPLPVPL